MKRMNHCRWLVCVPMVLTGSLLRAADQKSAAAPAPKKWTPSMSFSLRESYDRNVYLQKETARANQESLVSVMTPSFGLNWKPSDAFTLAASSAPEIAFYHSESSDGFLNAMESLKAEVGGLAVEFSPATHPALKQVYLTVVQGGKAVPVADFKAVKIAAH